MTLRRARAPRSYSPPPERAVTRFDNYPPPRASGDQPSPPQSSFGMSVDDNGTPWYMRGQLLLTNRLTIGALMKDLDSTAATAGGGVFATYDATQQRVIVTYQGVPAAGTTAPNTLQILIYASGEIDITIGTLAPTGPNYAPGILGTLGIASGRTRAGDFRKVKPIDFAALRDGPPVVLPFADGGAIYAQYYQGVSGSCPAADD